MERLEAALEKAREKRRSAGIDDTLVKKPQQRGGVARSVWADLPEITISNRHAHANRLAAIGPGPLSGPYDMLRSRALHSMESNRWKRLAITSPTGGCGKSTVATNLALSFARQPEQRVILLDLDLRRPALHKILPHRPMHGLSEVVKGQIEAEDHFVRYGENLAVGLNSKPTSSPAELLQSQQMTDFLMKIETRFQPSLMIFDMPPMLMSDDNVGFLKNVDCALLIGAAESSTVSQLDICEKDLVELTNVLGIVLNKCRFTDSSTGYDYDYDYS